MILKNPKPSKTMILAAGLGSRLKQNTADRPKALVEIGGRPILGFQLETLIEGDLDEIGIVLGYHGEMISKFVDKQFPGLDVTYFQNHEYATTNSTYSFWQAREWVGGGSAVHLNCDILFSKHLLKRLLESPHENVIAVRTDVPLGGRMEHIALNGDCITQMSLVQEQESVGKAFGLAKFGPSHFEFVCRYIEEHIQYGIKNEHYFGIIREAVKTLDYHALIASPDLLLEVNTVDDLCVAESILKNKEMS